MTTIMQTGHSMRRCDGAERVHSGCDESAWNDTFIDAPCDPPQSFTFGGVIAYVITYSAYRREVLIGNLAELGLHDIEPGDPMEWERLRQADRPRPAE